METWDGVNLWRQYLLPLRWEKGYRLGSPSTTNDPSGIEWIRGFLGSLGDNEKPDFLCLHWYGIGAGAMIDYLNQYHNAFPGYKLWITEFACNVRFILPLRTFSYSLYRTSATKATAATTMDLWTRLLAIWTRKTGLKPTLPLVCRRLSKIYLSNPITGFVQETYGVDERNRLINPWSGQITELGWHYIN